MTEALMTRINRRQLKVLSGGVVALVTTAMVAQIVWPQVRAYRTEAQLRETLELSEPLETLERTREDAREQVRSAKKRLHGGMPSLPARQIEAYIIGRLQEVSWRTDVDLTSVEPQPMTRSGLFDKTVFSVQLEGNYFDLFSWLSEVNATVGFVVIESYDIRITEHDENEPRLSVKLTMASYRSTQS